MEMAHFEGDALQVILTLHGLDDAVDWRAHTKH